MWQSAKPVPARRQKRLFDDTKEAEKILHFFESQSIGAIVRLTLASLLHSALVAMREQLAVDVSARMVANMAELQDRLAAQCCKLSRESWTDAPSKSE